MYQTYQLPGSAVLQQRPSIRGAAGSEAEPRGRVFPGRPWEQGGTDASSIRGLTPPARQFLGEKLLPRPLVLQRQPGAVGFAAGDGLLDEVHPFHAVVDVGVD